MNRRRRTSFIDIACYAFFAIENVFYGILKALRHLSQGYVLAGFVSGLLLTIFIYNKVIIDRYHSVEITYPASLDFEAINDIVRTVDEKEMPNDEYKVCNQDLASQIIIGKGHSLGYVLYQLYTPSFQVEKIVALLRKKIDLARIKPGHKIHIYYDCCTEYVAHKDFVQYARKSSARDWYGPIPMERNKICLIKKMTTKINDRQRAVITAARDVDFDVAINDIAITKKTRVTKGIIKNSLYSDAVNIGTPPGIIQAMIQEYSFDVDFQRDIHAGDSFVFVFEEMFDEEGEKIKNGILKYANLVLSGKNHKIYHFDKQFYNEKAESVRRALMKTPVDGARISSRFSKGRKHPVLGFTRKHEGIDFAVPQGTPIYAAADGVITFAGWSGGYGNYVKIKHNSEYGTNYGHMVKIKPSIHKGKHVKQREVIGYVGTTGLSTGPHLHFEVEKNGRKINPSSQKFASTTKLSAAKMAEFEKYRLSISKYLSEHS